jgi:ribosome-associated translation inhibitor RaiA
MQLPLQISFRHMERTPFLEATIREKAATLDHFAGRIMSCRVVVEPAGEHRLHGNQYEVRIDITLPGGEVVATREPSEHKEYKEIGVAIRDAFDAAARRLEEYVRIQRGDVNFHAGQPQAVSYDRLQVGTEVAFEEEEGERGPQASTVRIVGRHGGR